MVAVAVGLGLPDTTQDPLAHCEADRPIDNHDYNTMGPGTGGPAWHDAKALAPLALRMAQPVQVTGLSRSAIYRAAGKGTIVLLKAGRSTLVDMASVRAFLAGLPRATLRGQTEH